MYPYLVIFFYDLRLVILSGLFQFIQLFVTEDVITQQSVRNHIKHCSHGMLAVGCCVVASYNAQVNLNQFVRDSNADYFCTQYFTRLSSPLFVRKLSILPVVMPETKFILRFLALISVVAMISYPPTCFF